MSSEVVSLKRSHYDSMQEAVRLLMKHNSTHQQEKELNAQIKQKTQELNEMKAKLQLLRKASLKDAIKYASQASQLLIEGTVDTIEPSVQ